MKLPNMGGGQVRHRRRDCPILLSVQVGPMGRRMGSCMTTGMAAVNGWKMAMLQRKLIAVHAPRPSAGVVPELNRSHKGHEGHTQNAYNRERFENHLNIGYKLNALLGALGPAGTYIRI